MIKKIKLLTIIFLKDYYQNLNIINKKNNKLNRRSIYTWMLGILIFTVAFFSFKIIKELQNVGNPIIFLKICLPVIATIMIIQLITLVCRIFYYSKDLEYIMPLPIKTAEILVAKLNTVIFIMYFLELIYLLIPLCIYGILVIKTLNFFISMIIVLIVFPIIFCIIVSIILLFIMKLSKYIKNQDLFQLIVVFLLTFVLTFGEVTYFEKNFVEVASNESLDKAQIIEMKIDEINNLFVIINPSIKILNSDIFFEGIVNLSKIIVINIVLFTLYILLGKRLYLKNIIQNKNNIKIRNYKKNKYKFKNRTLEYIKKEIKQIIKNPSVLMQMVFQYLIIAFAISFIINIFIPIYIDQINESKILESISIDNLRFQIILITVGIIQLIYTFSNLAITAISREGKNARFMKYIPMSLNRQFYIKGLPQVLLNIIVIVIIVTTFYIKIPEATIIDYIITFIISMLFNILNSYIMLLIDLKKPNLNWTNEESIVKNNRNKLYQYIITIIICLLLNYFANVCEGINFSISIISIINLLLIIIIAIIVYVKKHINKIFRKII